MSHRCSECKAKGYHLCLFCGFHDLDPDVVIRHQKKKNHFGGHFIAQLPRKGRQARGCLPQRFRSENDKHEERVGEKNETSDAEEMDDDAYRKKSERTANEKDLEEEEEAEWEMVNSELIEGIRESHDYRDQSLTGK